jgi:coenzyme PQQ synthesis protein D (PqqD)
MSEPVPESAARIDAEFAPARAPGVYTVELDGEAVLLDEESDRLHHLNHTAALVWAIIDGRASIAELARDLADELGLPAATTLVDTIGIVRRLGEEGLLAGVVR